MPEHVSVLGIYAQHDLKGEVVRFKQILARVEQRLQRFPLLRQRVESVPLDLDYPYLIEDEEFDVEFHVRHLALPAPGDWRQFCIQVSRLHTRKLDRDRPLWEMYVIEGLNHLDGIPAGSFAIVLKIHLGLLDDVPAHEILSLLHDETDQTPPSATKITASGCNSVGAPPIHEMLLRGLGNSAIGAIGLTQYSAIEALRLGWQRVEKMVGSRRKTRRGVPVAVPRTRFDAKLTRYRVFDGVILPMADVRRVADALGVGLGDLTVSLCAGALHAYLGRKGELPRESLRAYVSWAHSASAFEDELAGQIPFPELVTEIGSQFSDPVARLVFLRGHLKNRPHRKGDTAKRQTLDTLADNLPAPCQSMLVRMNPMREEELTSFDARRHCSIRFIEDVNRSSGLLGASCLAVTYLAPLVHGCGLGFIASHDENSLMITFTADRDQIRDPEVLRGDLWRSFQAHLDSDVEQRAAAVRQRTGT